MVKLSQFRCQVLNTAGLQPEKAQAQITAQHQAGLTRGTCACKAWSRRCAKVHSDPSPGSRDMGLPGSRDMGLPGSRDTGLPRTLSTFSPSALPLQNYTARHLPSAQAQHAPRWDKGLGCLPGPDHVHASACFLPLSFPVKISWRNSHLCTR